MAPPVGWVSCLSFLFQRLANVIFSQNEQLKNDKPNHNIMKLSLYILSVSLALAAANSDKQSRRLGAPAVDPKKVDADERRTRELDHNDGCYNTKEELKRDINLYLNDPVARQQMRPIGEWCVSKITDFSSLFTGRAAPGFNEPLAGWDTSNAENMQGMFERAAEFNKDIGMWNTAKCTNMEAMFRGATKFNQDLFWETSQVTNFGLMFNQAVSFNGEVSTFDTSSATRMRMMFYKASKFDGDISNWVTSAVTDMFWMFNEATSFNKPLNNWDVRKVTDMSRMFRKASAFNQPLNKWVIDSVTNTRFMFQSAVSFDQDLTSWDISGVNDIRGMFLSAERFNVNMCKWAEPIFANNVRVDYSVFAGTACDSWYESSNNGGSYQNLCEKTCQISDIISKIYSL